MVSNDATLELLSRRRRLVTLLALRECEGTPTLDGLATEVAVRELDVPREAVTAEQADRVRVSLHHVHLPRLADAGLVEYASSDDRVRLVDGASDVYRVVDAVFED